MPAPEQRKTQRFNLRLPIRLIRMGGEEIGSESETRNISSAGVLFRSDRALPVGEALEYALTLPTGGRSGLRLHCVGKVVRLVRGAGQDGSVETAATLERYEFVRG
jgi:hypothetical protein